MFGERDMSGKSKCIRRVLQAAALAAIASPVFAAAPPAPTNVNGKQFFSWFQTGPDAPYPVATYPSGATTGTYVGTPFLTNSNAGAVNSYFTTLPPGAIRSVKIENPGINNATAALIFNNTAYNVSYVFGDLEQGTMTPDAAKKLVYQVKYANTTGTGPKTRSSNAWIGNFGFSEEGANKEAPSYYTDRSKHSFSAWTDPDYDHSGANMSNEETYPGSPSMRNKAAGDLALGGKIYPNIRSALIISPLWRVGNVTQGHYEEHEWFSSPSQHANAVQHIPWTANFNNWGNLGLDNNRDSSDGYKFVPNAPMLAATVGGHSYPAMTSAQTNNQNISERDFATMMLHMRLRGADSFHLLDSGLDTVSRTQMEQDAATGWLGESSVNAIMGASDRFLAVGDTFKENDEIVIDGVNKSIDQAGSLWSGAWSVSLKKLDVLLTNATDASHTLTVPSTIGGYSLTTSSFVIPAGTHMLVEYTLSGSGKNAKWGVAGQHVPYTAIDNSHNHFGIPEPGTLSLLAVASVFALNRRRREQD